MISIAAIAYVLPETRVSLEALAARGLIETPPEKLREFGFEVARVSDEPAEALAGRALAQLIAGSGCDPESVAALFHAGAIPGSHVVSSARDAVVDGFRYPASKLQYEAGLLNARAMGIGQQGCVGLMAAVHLASLWIEAAPGAPRVICTSADVLPRGESREFIYNVISDGACALLVERGTRNRLLAYRQITKGYYWDSAALKNEIVAAYFPTAQNLVRDTLADAGLTIDDIDWVIPHNVSARSWDILSRLLQIPRDRLFLENIGDKGHVIAADNFINLKDAADRGRLQRGQKLLLFTFGFGANWASMIVEH